MRNATGTNEPMPATRIRSGVSALLGLLAGAAVLVAFIVSGLSTNHVKTPLRPGQRDSGSAHKPVSTTHTGTVAAPRT